jgi:1-acyl-sn-glycerol-3-phosphate acyltransferase
MRQAGRLVALLGALLMGAALLLVLPWLPASARYVASRTWARAVLGALGVTLVRRGRLPRRRALLVSNHVSWLDIVAVLAVSPAMMLAKHEVRRWPLIGQLAAVGGTIFVDRTRPRQLPAVLAEVASRLRGDGVVLAFPEGTTWCGVPSSPTGCGGAGRFRPAMFQAAIDAGAVVVPLTMRYRIGQDRDVTTAAAFLGDDTLWASVRRVLAVRNLVVSVTAAEALHPDPSADRRVLARVAQSAVRLTSSSAAPTGTARRPAGPTVLDLAA